jgi:hypothetical protein
MSDHTDASYSLPARMPKCLPHGKKHLNSRNRLKQYSNTLIATYDTEVALKIVEGWVRYRAQKRGIQIPSVSVSERHSANNL